MRKIAAVYKKKKLKTNWGFVFDTDIQMHVERFMQKIHVGDDQYILYYDHEKPDGIYTDVKVNPIYNNGKLVDAEYTF